MLKRLLVMSVAFSTPLIAHAQSMPQATIADVRQGAIDAVADIGGVVLNLRTQIAADQRAIAMLQKQLEEASKTKEPAAPAPTLGAHAVPPSSAPAAPPAAPAPSADPPVIGKSEAK